MYPIYQNTNNENSEKGYSYKLFANRFIQICEEHLHSKRAKKFMFIFYDFESPMRQYLNDKAFFTNLNRESSRDTSIFYIHSNDKKVIKMFNELFFYAFEIEPPMSHLYLITFDLKNGDVVNCNHKEFYEKINQFTIYNELVSFMKKPKRRMQINVNRYLEGVDIVLKVEQLSELFSKIFPSYPT